MRRLWFVPLCGLLAAILISTACRKKTDEEPAPGAAEPEKEKKEEVYNIEIASSPVVGVPDAPVTVFNFSDFECPFSKRTFDTMERLLKKYDGRIAYVYKHYPLATHKEARRAAKAAIAAAKQDKFIEMYRKLFENGQSISADNLTLWAQELGLDTERFAKDYADPDSDRLLHEDVTQGNIFGVRGTPTLFINGRRLSGANSQQLEQIVEEELEKGEALAKRGIKDIYGELTRDGLSRYVPPKRPLPVVPADLYAVDIPPHAPVWGPPDAPVTVVLFTDFECPFCGRMHETFTQLKKDFDGMLRIVFVNLPLKFHNLAVPAAKAALAAGRQEKFWEMHDRLFADQVEWKKGTNFDMYLDGLAQELKIDVVKFKKDMEDPRTMEIIHRDLAFADTVGVRGTPGIFINGRYASGAFPLETFQKTIREELERARPLMEKGLKGDPLYYELIREGKPSVFISQPVPEDPDRIYTVKVTGQEPSAGKKNAPVTLIEFTDLQCTHCAAAAAAVDALQKEYRDSVRVVYKQFPLGRQHPAAEPSARLLLAVKRLYGDDRYQALRAKLLAARPEWIVAAPAPFFEKYAKEMKLDWSKIQPETASAAVDELLREDRAEAAKNGVRAAPTLFINGRKLNGPQSPERLKALVEQLHAPKK